MSRDLLPVSRLLPDIVAASRSGGVIVSAPPGSGKTTLVPSSILRDLPSSHASVILVQPRRFAARAVAHRIAYLEGSSLGDTVGYHVRFDRCAGGATRLLVATTGIVLRRVCDDIALDGVGAVILDEFHERSLELDTLFGYLVRLQQTLRPDLRIVVMSATVDLRGISRCWPQAKVLSCDGDLFPVEVRYEPRRENQPLEDHIAGLMPRIVQETRGHVLVFLPGVGEIHGCRDRLRPWAEQAGMVLMPLYGDLSPTDQDRVLVPSAQRKLILATNIAETSITIDGVTAVVDSGTARQLKVHPATGLPRLERVPISRASADQRAGRAGRTEPGVCWRLWDKASHAARLPYDPPEVLRSDLCQTLLQLLAWGERDVRQFPWLDVPPSDAIADARRLLLLLGAIDEKDRVTAVGERLLRIPTHPRLGRLMLAAAERGVLREATLAAALLTERDPFRARGQAASGPPRRGAPRSRSDLVDRVSALQNFDRHGAVECGDLMLEAHLAKRVLRVAQQLERLWNGPPSARAIDATVDPDVPLMQSLLDAFPDRVVRLRASSEDRGVLVGGRGVCLDPVSRVRGEPLFIALSVQDATGDARVTMASAIRREWLASHQLSTSDELLFHPQRRQVEARRRTYWMDLCLDETPTTVVDHEQAATILAEHAREAIESLLPDGKDTAAMFRRRVQWLNRTLPELGLPDLGTRWICDHLVQVCYGLRSLDDVRQFGWLAWFQAAVGFDRLAEIDRLAPMSLVVPSGSRIALAYEPDKVPVLAVRIQEIFGWLETPRVANGRVPVLLHLLGPNYRPQQITDDLASFWRNTYPVVRKELRRRYPKHAWPEDPLSAPATRTGPSRPT